MLAGGLGSRPVGPFHGELYRGRVGSVVQAQGTGVALAIYGSRGTAGTRPPAPTRARLEVWHVLAEYRAALDGLGTRTISTWSREITAYRAAPGAIAYRAAVVDESQDLHPDELRLVRRSSPRARTTCSWSAMRTNGSTARPAVLHRTVAFTWWVTPASCGSTPVPPRRNPQLVGRRADGAGRSMTWTAARTTVLPIDR